MFMSAHSAVVSREEWLKARKLLLREEKELTQARDRLSERRRELPWVEVEKDYVFDGPAGPVSLAELFEGRSQLLVYHFMFAPDWSQGCKSCSLVADHYDPAIVHLAHRDTTMIAVSRAPLDKLLAFRNRMGWTFNWVSSGANDFNRDYGVYFTPEERQNGLAIYNYESSAMPISDLPGLSVFTRDASGTIFHTYSTYARGLDIFLNVYNLLDTTPKGRDEEQIEIMSWVRHRDRYDVPGFVDPWVEAATSQAGVV
jgi:predicted dithiol-disulfide oxidoreductase (DUF899 family)